MTLAAAMFFCCNSAKNKYQYYINTDYALIYHPSVILENENSDIDTISICLCDHFVRSENAFKSGLVDVEFYLITNEDTLLLNQKEAFDNLSLNFAYTEMGVFQRFIYGTKTKDEISLIQSFFDSTTDSLIRQYRKPSGEINRSSN